MNYSKKKRIVIEHTICRLKKYRTMSQIFRNRLRKYDRISDIVTGLVNYRILNQQNLKSIYNAEGIIQIISNYARDLLFSYNLNYFD